MPKYKVPNFGPDGRPERLNSSTTSMGTIVPAGVTPPIPLPHAGDLGVVYEEGTKRWQIVEVVDAANPTGVGDIMFWKSYPAYTVTPTAGNSSRNEAAGVMELTSPCTTPSSTVRVCVALRQGGVLSVLYTGTAGLVAARGSVVVVDSVTTNQADVALLGTDIVLAGNENAQPIGIAQAAAGGGKLSTFLTIPSR